MFKSFISNRIETTKSKEEIYNLLEDRLHDLGHTEVSSNGRFNISGARFNGFGYSSAIEGKIKENDKSYTVNIDVNVKPEIISWIILVCFFPIGALILFLPYNANNEIEAKLKNALEDLRLDIEESKM